MGNLKWPEGKKCAVMFTFDVDGDTTWENGNRGLPNGEKYIKSLSVGQYGPKRCVDRILDMLESYGVKATFFVPGLTAERYPEVIMRIAEAGHEIGHHGYAHERFAGKTTEEQIEIIEKTQRIFKDLIGHEVQDSVHHPVTGQRSHHSFCTREVFAIQVPCAGMTDHIGL